MTTSDKRLNGYISTEGYGSYTQSVAALYAPHDGFREAMLSAGLVTDAVVIPDGQIHRFKAEGDRNQDSWYVFFGDGGAFGNWRTGLRERWFRGDLNDNRKCEIRKNIIAAQKASREKTASQHRQIATTARRPAT